MINCSISQSGNYFLMNKLFFSINVFLMICVITLIFCCCCCLTEPYDAFDFSRLFSNYLFPQKNNNIK